MPKRVQTKLKRLSQAERQELSAEWEASDLNQAEFCRQKGIEAAEDEVTIPEHTRKKAERKGLAQNLPRKQIIHDLTGDEKICSCGCELTHIDDEITEQLDIVSAKIYVIQHVCKKYACKHGCENSLELR